MPCLGKKFEAYGQTHAWLVGAPKPGTQQYRFKSTARVVATGPSRSAAGPGPPRARSGVRPNRTLLLKQRLHAVLLPQHVEALCEVRRRRTCKKAPHSASRS